MLQNFIYSNYATCLIVLFMVTFLLTNTTFNRKETGLFCYRPGSSDFCNFGNQG